MKVLVVILILITLLFVGVIINDHYKIKPLIEFCDSITIGTSSFNLIKRAKEANFLFFSEVKPEDERIRVFNQQSPWGRYACEMHFSQTKLTSKRVFEAD